VEAIKTAIDAGYRLFDTAFLYGNESDVGQAIADKIYEGVVKRDEIFIVGKLWGIHHEQVERACRDTCKRLNVDYVDLYLFHFPVSFVYRGDDENWPRDTSDILDKDFMDVWREMERLVEIGLARGIGVSNFNEHQIQRLYDNSKVKPACHEMEFHPGFARHTLLELCRNLNVTVLGFCPLGRHNPDKNQPQFIYDSKLREIAEKYGKTAAQITLRFSIQLGAIPIPKSATKHRIEENLNVFDFQLTDDEMNYLRTFHGDENQICKFQFAECSEFYPF
jgi:aldehyde reductase